MKEKTDMRIIKTRANLRNSLLKLLQKKTMNEISVKEICDIAQCSRNTFYMHYPYKEALYEELIDLCIMQIQQIFTAPLQKKMNPSIIIFVE